MEIRSRRRGKVGAAQRAVSLVVALSVTGCAINPMVDWKASEPPTTSGRADSMQGAQDYARAYKEAVHAKARDYAGAQATLNDALLGLGLLALTSVAYKAHRDVPLGFGILAAGTYMFGTQNLGKPRLDVYQSGIGATNCALAAVEPLNYSGVDLQEIDKITAEIVNTDRPLLDAWLARARLAFQEAGVKQDLQAEVNSQLAAAAATLEYSRTTVDEAAALRGRVGTAAGALRATVDTIAAQVDKLASNTIVDPKSVQSSLGNLTSLVGAFTPGTDVGTTLSSRLQPPDGKAKTMDGVANDGQVGITGRIETGPLSLGGVLTRLAHARSKVHGQTQMLAGAVAKAKGYAATEFLKACGVSDSLIALRVEEEVVTINVGADAPPPREVRAFGGAKNYTGRFLDNVPVGVELVQPRAGDGTFQIKVAKSIAKDVDLTLRIEDSSNPPQAKNVKVKIVIAPPEKKEEARQPLRNQQQRR